MNCSVITRFLVVSVLGLVSCLAACSDKPSSLSDFIELDAGGKKINCKDLIDFAGRSSWPVVAEAADFGHSFGQCHSELEADRHATCKEYSTQLRHELTSEQRNIRDMPTLEDEHLPFVWTQTCPAEIRAGLAGLNDTYRVVGGKPNPLLDLTRQGVAVPFVQVKEILIESRDSNVGVWHVDIDTVSSGSHALWFTDETEARNAYYDLLNAWNTQIVPLAQPKSNGAG
jgi:hypothetical protein